MYDIIYLGGGINYAGAIMASEKGKKVALIEKNLNHLVGVCLHEGCIPEKMFLRYSNIINESKTPILDGNLKLSIKKLVEEKDKLVESVTKGVTNRLSNVDLIEGEGKLIEPYKIEVNGQVLQAKNIVIGTGSSHIIPDGIEYDSKNIVNSDDILNITELPSSIVVYGNSYIALEMASFFATSDIDVTLIFDNEYLLPKADESIQKVMETQFENLGVTIINKKRVESAKTSNNSVHIVLDDKSEIQTPMLLCAVGKKPNLDYIKTKDIEIKNNTIVTDKFFQTTLENHYAVGDCNGKFELASAAKAEVLNVTAQILGINPKPVNPNNIVKFTHTLPMSYAIVGKRSENSKMMNFNRYPYAIYNNAKDGIVIIYLDKENFIVGAEILAPNAEDLISVILVAIVGEMNISQLKNVLLTHPTFSETIGMVIDKI